MTMRRARAHRISGVGIAATISMTLVASMLLTPAQAAPVDDEDVAAQSGSDNAEPQATGLTAADSFAARATAVSSGQRVEDVSQKTESTKTFANPDGTWTTEDYGEPVQIEGADGTWSDIDLNLVKNKDGSWSPKVAATDIVIGGDNAVEVALNDEGTQRTVLTWPQDLPEPTIKGSTATFEVSDTRDLIVTATPIGATYVLRLNEAPLPDERVFEFELETQGVAVHEEAGVLSLRDEDGEHVGEPVPLVAWDDSRDKSGDFDNVVSLDATVTPTDGTEAVVGSPVTLSLEAPEGFLDDPKTQYPVIIDPAIGRVAGAGDTWVRSGLTTKMGGASYLVVGKTETAHTGDALTYIKWDVSKAVGYTVTKADVNLYQYDAGTCQTSALTNVHPVSSDFTMSQIVWTNKPSVNTSSGASTSFTATRGRNGCTDGLGNGWVSFSVKAMVQKWADKTLPNYGMQINAPSNDKDNTLYGKRFCSWNEDVDASACNTSTRSPYLSVTYSKTPSAPIAPTFTSTNVSGWSNAATLALTAKGTDSLGDKVKYTIEVRDSAGSTVVKSCTTALVATGNGASCNVTGLSTGTYKVYAKTTNEPGLVSAYSSATTLNYDVTKPTNATVTASGYSSSGLWLATMPSSNTFTFKSTSADVQRFDYVLDGGTTEKANATVSGASATATVSLNPTGGHELVVWAVDKAGNKSGTAAFKFGNGNAAIQAPTSAGAKTVSTFDVKATAPGDGLRSYKLMWRMKGDPESTDFDPATGSTSEWEEFSSTDTNASSTSFTAVATFNASTALEKLKEVTKLDRTRKHTVFEVQICFTYSGGATKCTWTADTKSHATITYVPHAFGSNFPVADAGPGQVALWTGEFNTSVTDVSVPGYLGDLSVSRSFSTFNNQQDGPFGKGWKPSFDGTDAGVAGYEIVDDTGFDGTIALVDEEESAIIFSQGPSSEHQKVGAYTAVDDETAQLGLNLEITTVSGVKKLVLTEDDGTITTWMHQGSDVWVPESVMVAGDPSATRFTYDSNKNLTRIVAPHPDSVSCTAGSEQPGCRVLMLDYTTVSGKSRVSQLSYRAFDPQTNAMKTTVITKYAYDANANLIKVTDDRTGLATSYEYGAGAVSTVTRLTKVTPSGLDAYTLAYKSGSATAAFTDGVVSVKHGSTYTNAFGYDIGVTNANLPDMSATQIGKWGQSVVPTNVFASFGQDSAAVAVSGITADALKKADLSYTDADGRVINTVSYTGAQGGSWLYTATDFDGSGNVIRSLDSIGISQILKAVSDGTDVTPDDYASITRYNADITAPTTVTVAGSEIAAGSVVTPAGTLVTDSWEPVREIVQGDGTITLGRQHTHTSYDEGAPNGGYNPDTGLPFRLATTTTVTLAEPGTASSDVSVVLPSGEPVLTEQRSGYDPIDGASNVGKTSGWMNNSPTMSTTENGANDIVTKTQYDEQGRTIKEIGADSNGSDAGTTLTYYYDAGAPAGTPSVCTEAKSAAKWAGLACQTTTGEATPTVASTTTTQYSFYLASLETVEELDGVKRTSTTTYDRAGRVEQSETTVTGLTGSTALPRTKNIYDAATGLQTEVQTLKADGTVKASVKTGYDSWGRTISYTDENGKKSTTTYDAAGRVAKETSPDNVVTTYTYDAYTGSVTKKNISGVGDFTATYNRAGDITSQTLPTGVTQTSTYDRTGQETSLAYTITGDEGEASYAWTTDHDEFGRIFKVTGPSATNSVRTSTYEFDQVARMISASDQIDDVCATRAYTFDTVGRRTKLKTTSHTCDDTASATSSTKTWDYDKADRLLTGANGTGTYTYDTLGRQLSLPAIDTPQGETAGNLTASYFDNDLARTVTQDGVTTTYDIDVMERRSTSTTTGGSESSTTVRYYEDTSDNPAWATTTTGGDTETSRYLSSIAGDLSVTKNMTTGFLSAGIIDPQGSVVATTYAHTIPADIEAGTPEQSVTAWSGLELFDEYGNKLNNVVDKATGALRYAWLGGKERATDTSGLVLMGVRLYNSVTGHFTSVDPVVGGNTTRYSYPQDPINQFDLDGKAWNWRKTAKSVGRWAWKNKVDIALTAVSFIPGGALLRVGYGVAKGVRIYQAAKKAQHLGMSVSYGRKASTLSQNVAGRLWAGKGANVSKGGKQFRSTDGHRQFRKNSYKPNRNSYQANLESWKTPRKSSSQYKKLDGKSNYHINWSGRRW